MFNDVDVKCRNDVDKRNVGGMKIDGELSKFDANDADDAMFTATLFTALMTKTTGGQSTPIAMMMMVPSLI